MEFSSFWTIYPRRVGKMKAEKLWLKLSNDEQMDVLRGVTLWKKTYQWQLADGIYIPYASTFLAQRRWEDEPWTGAFQESA
jgi:hypothetical protein